MIQSITSTKENANAPDKKQWKTPEFYILDTTVEGGPTNAVHEGSTPVGAKTVTNHS